MTKLFANMMFALFRWGFTLLVGPFLLLLMWLQHLFQELSSMAAPPHHGMYYNLLQAALSKKKSH